MMDPIRQSIIDQFKSIVGEAFVILDENLLHKYAHDETEELFYLPQVAIRPSTPQEISEILKICNQYKIPVTPRGAGTGLSGGALPHLGGVLLATDRLNKIIEIDEKKFTGNN